MVEVVALPDPLAAGRDVEPGFYSRNRYRRFDADFHPRGIVRVGIVFKGIAYESDRPNIIPQLPCGGEDIQDEPVYWTLHDGRVVCWSVCQLAAAKEADLEPVDSLKRYKAVAKELGLDVQSLSSETRAI